MRWTTLISVEELAETIDHCTVIDTRHDLSDPVAGPAAYAAGHIPGAYFLHQDKDLAGPRNGTNGRHPLPAPDALVQALRATGLSAQRQLVVYDQQGGMFAARLWWLARWLGHQAVAVLDGGLDAWQRAGYPVDRNTPAPKHGDFAAATSLVSTIDAAGVASVLGSDARLIVDARAPERYRGDVEPLDPVAGHIPGAVNRPFQDNLRPDGRFKPAPILRQAFEQLLGGRSAAAMIHQCGSGVSACHNLLAMEHAGLAGSALYPGSWSEWCSDPARPVARGEAP